MKNNMEYILWIDSSSTSGWVFVENMDYSLVTVESIGWVIKEDSDSVTIASHRTGHGEVHSPMTIPKINIVSRESY